MIALVFYVILFFKNIFLVLVVVVICSCRMIQSGQSRAQSRRLVAHWSDVN